MAAPVPHVDRRLLRRYLLSTHWNLQRRAGSFELFSRDDVELVVPSEARSEGTRLDAVLRALSQFEDRGVPEVAADIRAVGFDVVRSRLPDSALRSGSVTLEAAVEFVQHAKDLLSATATTEIEPRRAFMRNRSEALEYSSRCLFGHTFPGSFGFVIESPVSPNDAPVLIPGAAPVTSPFERRVVERLVRGLHALDVATQMGSIDVVVAGSVGVISANMCDEVAALLQKVSHSIEISIAFSPEWPTSDEKLVRERRFMLGGRHGEIAEAAAARLRELVFERTRTVVGRVVRLESEQDPSNLLEPAGSRQITVEWFSPDMGKKRVRVPLQPQDYLVVVEAHKAGQTIAVTGELEKRGRYWWLVGAHSVRLETGGSPAH